MKQKNSRPKRIYRSRKNKMIAGVCGGFGEYLNVDPTWIRLIAVLLVLADGIGILLYIIAWIIIPENPDQKPTAKTTAEKITDKITKRKK